MRNKTIKILISIICMILLVILVRQNVKVTKEPSNIKNSTEMQLEVKSELVQKVYSKLSLLENSSFNDDVYDSLYFNIEDGEKRLSLDEKLYIVFQELYRQGNMSVDEKGNDTKILSIKKSLVNSTFTTLFRESILLDRVNYKVSENCGITDYSIKEDSIDLELSECSNDKIKKSKLLSASKKGDYIDLKIKAFLASPVKTKKDSKTFNVKNYGEKKILLKVSNDDLNSDDIFDTKGIFTYTFSFVLKGDEYYLDTIKRDALS